MTYFLDELSLLPLAKFIFLLISPAVCQMQTNVINPLSHCMYYYFLLNNFQLSLKL